MVFKKRRNEITPQLKDSINLGYFIWEPEGEEGREFFIWVKKSRKIDIQILFEKKGGFLTN